MPRRIATFRRSIPPAGNNARRSVAIRRRMTPAAFRSLNRPTHVTRIEQKCAGRRNPACERTAPQKAVRRSARAAFWLGGGCWSRFGFRGGRRSVSHAANACRTAAASTFSPASVNRDPLMNPILANVTSAIGSQKSAETPSANIAIARCSSRSRSFQEIPSISHLGPFVIPDAMTGRKS
jgi:hypothetical protein